MFRKNSWSTRSLDRISFFMWFIGYILVDPKDYKWSCFIKRITFNPCHCIKHLHVFCLILGGVLTCAYNSTRLYRNNHRECVLQSVVYETRDMSEIMGLYNWLLRNSVPKHFPRNETSAFYHPAFYHMFKTVFGTLLLFFFFQHIGEFFSKDIFNFCASLMSLHVYISILTYIFLSFTMHC